MPRTSNLGKGRIRLLRWTRAKAELKLLQLFFQPQVFAFSLWKTNGACRLIRLQFLSQCRPQRLLLCCPSIRTRRIRHHGRTDNRDRYRSIPSRKLAPTAAQQLPPILRSGLCKRPHLPCKMSMPRASARAASPCSRH